MHRRHRNPMAALFALQTENVAHFVSKMPVVRGPWSVVRCFAFTTDNGPLTKDETKKASSV